MKAKPKTTKRYDIPEPHPMFPPEITAIIRFVTYGEAVECPLCKKKKHKHWTMLCPFQAASMSRFAMQMDPRIFQPGESVCGDHPLKEIEAVREMFCYPEAMWWKKLGEVFDETCVAASPLNKGSHRNAMLRRSHKLES